MKEWSLKTYRRSLLELIKGIIIALFTGFVIYIVLSWFISNAVAGLGIPALVALAILYITVFSEDIYFELEPDGVLRYYKRRIIQNTFDLKNCYIWYQRKSETGFPPSHDITLKVLNTGAEDGEVWIDCSSLGLDQFNEMFTTMEEFALKDKSVLSAGNAKSEEGKQGGKRLLFRN
jgi:hypothetical protein